MAKFKIIPIKHLLKNNKTAKAGEVVDGSAFVNLQDSLDRGFCKEVEVKKEDKKELTEAEKAIAHIKTLNKDPLIEWASENEIDIDETLKKKEILAFLIEEIEALEED